MKKTFLTLILVISFISCKKETEKKPILKNNEKKEFIVKVSLQTDKEDELKILVNNVRVNRFQRKNIEIKEKLIVLDKPKTYNFNLKEDFSNSVRLSLGNKEEKTIKVRVIEITYQDIKIRTNGNDLDKYFTFNKYVTYNKENSTLTIKKVDGKLNPVMRLNKSVFKSKKKK